MIQENIFKFSIIVIVKNDIEVFSTLNALIISSDLKNTEIILVDASDKDIKSKYGNNRKIKWILFKSKFNKRITIPEQRNIGINNAIGKVIVFIDASCIPADNWLNELTNPIITGKEFIVAGSILSTTSNKRHDSRNIRLKGKEYLDEAPTMNLAVKKDVFEKIGYFDENFDYGSDVDFTRRAIKNGYKIKYSPKAIVYHNWGTFKDEIKRAFRYGEARVNIYKKYKKNIIAILKEDPITIIYPLFILFLPIIFIFPWYLLLLIIPIIKNSSSYPLKNSILNLTYGLGILYKLLIA